MTIMTLADGRKFDTVTKTYISEDLETNTNEVTKERDDVSLSLSSLTNTRMRLEDLPTNPKQMNVVCAVTTYVMLGLSDSEICVALNCTIDQLYDVKNSDALKRTQDILFTNIKKKFEDEASARLSMAAPQAANKIVDLMNNKNAAVALKAAENVLDRSGVGSSDSFKGMGKGLTIRVVKDKQSESMEINVNG